VPTHTAQPPARASADRVPGESLPTGPLRLGRPEVRVFPARPRPPEPGEDEVPMLTDLLAGLGLRIDLEQYARGGGNSFSRMSGELLDGLDRPLPPLDAVVLAYHLPDLRVTEAAGCYVAGRFPGEPAVFSVSEQGVGAPFTALRILHGMRLSGGLRDGAVLVLDQTTSLYRDADVHDAGVRDCTVLLRTDAADGDAGCELDFLDEEPVTDPTDALRLTAARFPRARVLAGRMLADRVDPRARDELGIVEGPRRHLCTSAWAALAQNWPPDRYTVVADYDPHAGRLFQAGLRPGVCT
jgi:hypothetical protein